jgi:tripartite-type tricarboxylate transporter receptor subunit TctC
MKRLIPFLFAGFVLVFFLLVGSQVFAAPYYQGKVLTIIVGYPAGGGYDLMARFIAKHLPMYIPGKPTIIIENRPGASSIIAANHLYNRVKPDGLTIAAVNKALAFPQMLAVDGVKYDVNKFSWLGSSSIDATVLVVRSDLPYKTFDELLKSKKPIFLAGSGPSDINTQVALMLKEFTGLNVKLVEYRGTPEIWLAIEKKEVDGMAIAYNSGRTYIERGLVRPLLRTKISQKGIEHLPIGEDFATSSLGKTVMAMHAAVGQTGRPFMAPPELSPQTLDILRDGFAKTIKDPQVQEEAEKAWIEINYVSPEDCLKVVNYLFSQPPNIVKEFSKYVKF